MRNFNLRGTKPQAKEEEQEIYQWKFKNCCYCRNLTAKGR